MEQKTNVATIKPQSLPALAMSEDELVAVLTTSLYPGAAIPSIKMVLSYCKAAGLDPMQKPCHIVPMWDSKAKAMRDVVMPGIGLYRTQAARSGAYAGVTEPEFGADVTETFPEESGYEGKRRPAVTVSFPVSCKVVVKRRMPDGQIAEFAATERWKENYATAGKDSRQPNAMWLRRPYAQLAKCAEAQALRKAFPEFGAAPTADEMEGKSFDDGAIIDHGTGEIVNKLKELPAYTDEQVQANLAAWQAAINAGKSTPQKIVAMVSTKFRLSLAQAELIRGLTKESFVAEMEAADQGETE